MTMPTVFPNLPDEMAKFYKSSPANTSATLPNIHAMNFYTALENVMLGSLITKLEWNDPAYYGLMRDGSLMLHKPDGKFYFWTLTDGDISGTDWVLLPPQG